MATVRVGLKRSASPREAFVLLTTIWLGVMVVAIFLFTDWIAGSGEDYATRVLLRYYDFILPLAAIARLVVALDPRISEAKQWRRWLALLGPIAAAGSAF